MARIAVVTSSPPGVEGGHLVIARAIVRAAEESGHQASLIITPDFGFGRTFATYRANRRTPVDGVDQVISLRYPSYAVRHKSHVCWLNHTMREYYDLWPSFAASVSPLNRVKESVRRAGIRMTDRWLLTNNVDRIVAQSETIRRRLTEDFGLRAEVLHPPPPQRAYRRDEYGSYIFTVSRLVPLKRVDLLVRALAEPAARHVTAVVAGDGPSLGDLRALARALGVETRVTFPGRIDDDAMLMHLARCRAVCFTPLAEDYGFVTAEAFASGKAVVTCKDSGGPADLVVDGETGLVCEPTPEALASALARLTDDARLAERMGGNAAAHAATMRWDTAIARLLQTA